MRWVTLFGSVATQVVDAAHSPVVVVRGDVEPSGPVVVAVGGSADGEQAMRFAFIEAARRRCALHAVHAWQPPLVSSGVGLRGGTVVADRVTDETVAATAWRSLTDAVARWRTAFPDVAVHERLIQGPPEIVMAGETSGAALAVVGSRGRGPLAGLLLGSTSQALLHMSKCPVVVVRNPDIDPAHGTDSTPGAPADATDVASPVGRALAAFGCAGRAAPRPGRASRGGPGRGGSG